MESQSLQTASSYINNLLLSRGLLRNGVPVQFATPSEVEGGVDATMAKVMNLIHDMILRRDRETDTLSNVSQNLQTLRTSFAQQSQTIARLETRNADLDRQLALSSAQENAARATLRSAETKTKALKEELARLKGTVVQIRGQCANELRRRDGEIQKLKRSIEPRRGRDGNGGQAAVMVVKPGVYKGQQENRLLENGVDLESPDYSLKQETTEFLTQLIHGLSDENDALIGLVKSTLETLKSLQGLPKDSTQGLDQSENAVFGSGDNTLAAPLSYENLATTTDQVLEHLRGLLTNPSFVPLEEVEIREEEIIRLREGWEKMEARWKEAVALMDGWRKRMVNSGDTINMDDLRIGLNLGSETLPSFPLRDESAEPKQEPVEDDFNSSLFFGETQDDVDGPSEVHTIDELSADELDLPIAPTSRALTTRSPNARPKLSPRKSPFSPIPEENTRQLRDAEQGVTSFGCSPYKPPTSPRKPKPRIKQQGLCSPAPSPRTVSEKLALAQAEAEEARKREESRPKSKTTRRNGGKLRGSRRRSTLSPEELENLLDCL